MSSLDEPNGTGGDDRGDDTPVESLCRPALETRVRVLERENAALKIDIEALRADVTHDRQLLEALAVQGIPVDPREMREMHANSQSLSGLLAESEQ